MRITCFRSLFSYTLSPVLGWFNNPVNLLIAAQGAFISAGLIYLDFGVTSLQIILSVGTAILTELMFSNFGSAKARSQPIQLFFPSSAVAAALGICIFFRATTPGLFALAAFLAIASKYIIKIRGRHIFNPSNFAIVLMAFAFTSSATIEFTQWGNNIYLLLAIAMI